MRWARANPGGKGSNKGREEGREEGRKGGRKRGRKRGTRRGGKEQTGGTGQRKYSLDLFYSPLPYPILSCLIYAIILTLYMYKLGLAPMNKRMNEWINGYDNNKLFIE